MWNHLEEMEEVYNVLYASPYVRQDTIEYWFHDFYTSKCVSNETADAEEEEFFGKAADCTDGETQMMQDITCAITNTFVFRADVQNKVPLLLTR